MVSYLRSSMDTDSNKENCEKKHDHPRFPMMPPLCQASTALAFICMPYMDFIWGSPRFTMQPFPGCGCIGKFALQFWETPDYPVAGKFTTFALCVYNQQIRGVRTLGCFRKNTFFENKWRNPPIISLEVREA